jgi:hypothetical protein
MSKDSQDASIEDVSTDKSHIALEMDGVKFKLMEAYDDPNGSNLSF